MSYVVRVSSPPLSDAAAGLSSDGEPLCLPPPPGDLCEVARRRLPQVEAELRRRLSGPDRSIEAVELDALAQGARAQIGARIPAEAQDPLLEQGLLALGAAQLLQRQPMLPLGEVLALRGVRVQRGTLLPDHPPRALEDLRHGGGKGRNGASLEIYRAERSSPAARALIALSAAGLTRPVVLVDPGPAPFSHVGLPPQLRDVVVSSMAPHEAEDAAAPMALLLRALVGRNPWHLYTVAELPWPQPGGPHRVAQPQLTATGLALAERVLLHPPTPEESFALACHALAAAEHLQALVVPAGQTESTADRPTEDADQPRLTDALRRLLRRPLSPGPPQAAEAALFLRLCAEAEVFVVEAHHPDEMGRLLCASPLGRGHSFARLHLFGFPEEPRRALAVTLPPLPRGASPMAFQHPYQPAYHVDGGDLRVHIEILPGTGLLGGP